MTSLFNILSKYLGAIFFSFSTAKIQDEMDDYALLRKMKKGRLSKKDMKVIE